MSATLCFTSFCSSSQKSLPVLIASSIILPTLSFHPGNRNWFQIPSCLSSNTPFVLALVTPFANCSDASFVTSSSFCPSSLLSRFPFFPWFPSFLLFFATTFASTSYFFLILHSFGSCSCSVFSRDDRVTATASFSESIFVEVVFSQLRSSQDDLFYRSCSPSFLSPQSLFIVWSRSLHRRVVSPRTTPNCEIKNDVTIHFRFVEDFSVLSSMSSGSSRCSCSEGTNFHLNSGSLVLHMIVMKYPSPHRTSSFKSRALTFRLIFWWTYSEFFLFQKAIIWCLLRFSLSLSKVVLYLLHFGTYSASLLNWTFSWTSLSIFFPPIMTWEFDLTAFSASISTKIITENRVAEEKKNSRIDEDRYIRNLIRFSLKKFKSSSGVNLLRDSLYAITDLCFRT